VRAAAGDEWKVLTLTAETARNAVVALVVFGDKDTSEPIILGQSVGGLFRLGQSMGSLFRLGQSVGGLFHAGHIDEFKVRCPAIIYSVRRKIGTSSLYASFLLLDRNGEFFHIH